MRAGAYVLANVYEGLPPPTIHAPRRVPSGARPDAEAGDGERLGLGCVPAGIEAKVEAGRSGRVPAVVRMRAPRFVEPRQRGGANEGWLGGAGEEAPVGRRRLGGEHGQEVVVLRRHAGAVIVLPGARVRRRRVEVAHALGRVGRRVAERRVARAPQERRGRGRSLDGPLTSHPVSLVVVECARLAAGSSRQPSRAKAGVTVARKDGGDSVGRDGLRSPLAELGRRRRTCREIVGAEGGGRRAGLEVDAEHRVERRYEAGGRRGAEYVLRLVPTGGCAQVVLDSQGSLDLVRAHKEIAAEVEVGQLVDEAPLGRHVGRDTARGRGHALPEVETKWRMARWRSGTGGGDAAVGRQSRRGRGGADAWRGVHHAEARVAGRRHRRCHVRHSVVGPGERAAGLPVARRRSFRPTGRRWRGAGGRAVVVSRRRGGVRQRHRKREGADRRRLGGDAAGPRA
mmetsp:Transcript_6245/g.20516  ORF Transcript_6245/g.20516 Transcript_6245/m.20516 type:complete len:455 (+) Transcript_6245:1060-2424(+)|eukprot:scaffold5654_cov119-Isochrysis_galbana.AAC.5